MVNLKLSENMKIHKDKTKITPWRQRTLNKIFEILSWINGGTLQSLALRGQAETAKFASDADSSDVCETEKAQTIIHREHKMYTIRTSFTGVVHRWHINIPSRWRLRGNPLFRIRNTCTHADEHHYKVPSYPTVQEHESISSRDSHGTGDPRRVRCPSKLWILWIFGI